MLLRLLLLVLAVMGGGVQADSRCPDGYWRAEDGNQCLWTDAGAAMKLADAEAYCAGLPVPGRLFHPLAGNIDILKEYADQTFLAKSDLWSRYWVGLTKDLSDAWQRNGIDSQEDGPYCVALDYRRPTNARHLSFYGYDSPTCQTDVKLPAICSADPTVQAQPKLEPEPEPFDGETDRCLCPDCPAVSPCPEAKCPVVEPCQNDTPPLQLVLQCPPNWFTRMGFCYHFLLASKTWPDASASCQKDGAELVSIQDKEENDYLALVSDELSEASPTMRRYWIGLKDRDEEGKMSWTSGAPLDFTSWGPRNPSVHKKRRLEENCVVINSQSPGLWDDIPCWRRHPYICKKAADELVKY